MSTKMDDVKADETLNELKSLFYYEKDEKKFRSDVPGYLSVGAQVSIIKKIRLNASYRYFDEKHAKRDMVEDVKNNKGTHEPAFGIEWDIFKFITVSAGYQGAIYGSTEKELLSSWDNFTNIKLNNHSLLLGLRINAGKHVSIDLGYMHTFYKNRDLAIEVETENGTETNVTTFKRKSDLFGVGVNLAF
jgi:long-chain fatty acid transport protein